MPIAASDVPVAVRGANRASPISIGTTTAPPPTPKSAEKKPAASPIPTYSQGSRTACGTRVL
jgi:hypothetical protein